MFRLIFILISVIFIITSSSAQTSNFYKEITSEQKGTGSIFINEYCPKPKWFYKHFIHLLDSTKNAIYAERFLSKENLIVQRWFSFNTYFDALGSKACEHHNNYMFNMAKYKIEFLSHEENKTLKIVYDIEYDFDLGYVDLIDTVFYSGKDSLINDFSERALYYSNNNFSSIGECSYVGKIKRRDYTDKEFANDVFNEFKKSKFYWNILMNDAYNSIAMNLLIDEKTNRFWLTINVGYSRYANDDYKYNYDLKTLTVLKDLNEKKKKVSSKLQQTIFSFKK